MSRKFRLAIMVVILFALGAFAISRGAWSAALAPLGAATALLAFVWYPSRVPRDAVVVIRLSGRMREYSLRSPIEQLLGRVSPSLYSIRRALEAIRRDTSVRTVIVDIAGLEIGLATACEIHDLLRSVGSAGQRVVAILAGDQVNVREYVAACGAGEVVATPDSAFIMLGVAAGSVFVKGALERFHIQAQTLQWKEYKGAAEAFTRESMSAELRESLEAIVTDWLGVMSEKVAASRKLDPQRARQLLAEGFVSAQSARDLGLVDRVGYAEDLEAELDPAGEGKRFIGLGRYLRHLAYSRRPTRNRIALVHGVGPVIAGEPPAMGDFLSGEAVAAEIIRAARDKRVRAIVMRVNSPGGSAVGADLVWRATLEARRRGKPLVVSMGDVAGSGGYYVSMAADAIVAEAATITGSIGVVNVKLSLRDLFARLGIGIDYAKSDELSDALSPWRPMTESELAQLNKLAGEMYAVFTRKVAEGRRLEPERTELVARGRVWSGTAARANGLVDELGGLERAILIARAKAGLKPSEACEVIPFPQPTTLSGLRLALAPAQMPGLALGVTARSMGVPAEWIPAMLRLLTETRALLLCPFF